MEPKKEELLRFLLWIAQEPDAWWNLCCEESTDIQECMDLVEKLKQEEFYILIPILIGRNLKYLSIEDAVHKLCFQKIVESWKHESLEKINREIINVLADAKERYEKRKEQEKKYDV